MHSISVLYSDEKKRKREDKNCGGTFIIVAHLTDRFLEAVKACQGGNRDWKVISLNNCKWIE